MAWYEEEGVAKDVSAVNECWHYLDAHMQDDENQAPPNTDTKHQIPPNMKPQIPQKNTKNRQF